MTSAYPGALDALAINKTDATATATDHAQHHNDLADAVNKIESTLGTNPQDAATTVAARITTVESALNSRDMKASCRLSSTGNIAPTASTALTLTVGGTTLSMDGYAVVNGDRVFLKDQNTPSQNGIYVVSGVGSSVLLTRSEDANNGTVLSDSTFISVEQGAYNGDTLWELNTDNPITVGTTSLYWTRIHPYYPQSSGGLGRDFIPDAAKIESLNRVRAALANSTGMLATGTARFAPLGVLRAGHSLSAITFCAGSQAGASLTHQWAGIASFPDFTIRAVSADLTTAAWAANTLKTFTFGATYTAPYDMPMLAFIMVSATTVPTLIGIVNGTSNALLSNPVVCATWGGALTTPPAVGSTITGYTVDTRVPYCYAG